MFWVEAPPHFTSPYSPASSQGRGRGELKTRAEEAEPQSGTRAGPAFSLPTPTRPDKIKLPARSAWRCGAAAHGAGRRQGRGAHSREELRAEETPAEGGLATDLAQALTSPAKQQRVSSLR